MASPLRQGLLADDGEDAAHQARPGGLNRVLMAASAAVLCNVAFGSVVPLSFPQSFSSRSPSSNVPSLWPQEWPRCNTTWTCLNIRRMPFRTRHIQITTSVYYKLTRVLRAFLPSLLQQV